MKKLILSILVAIPLFGCADKKPEPQPEPKAVQETKKEPAPPQMSPDEMMAKIKDAGTPGAEHANLQPLVGKWKTEAKFWADPSKDPEISKGTSTEQWIYGKRFIKEEYTGKFSGQPFQGMGILGFDKTKKQYVSNWADSMSTGIMTSEGTFDPASKTIEMTGKYSCPVEGKERQSRTVTRIISNNEHVFEMYDLGPDGKEYKTLEITYKRQG